MSIEDFEEIIRKIHKHTKLVCLHVKGEPLLHSQIDEILTLCDNYQLNVKTPCPEIHNCFPVAFWNN